VLRYSQSGYEVLGVVSEQRTERDDMYGYPILGHARQLPQIYLDKPMDTIIVALDEQRGFLPTEELMELKLTGVRIIDNVSFHELFSGKIVLESLRPSWFVFTEGFKISRLRLFLKRVFDVVTASAGLVVTLPLVLISIAAIKLTSRGPVLYRQERVGKGGRTFQLLKFRSMYADAEAKSGPVWAAQNHTRVTPVGRFIRRFRVDEIPQMWNVLNGQMSFVGPRPERPFFVRQLTAVLPYYNQRHIVKPGITGWAQVRYPYGASVEDAREKLQLDLYYIKHTNLGFDIKILLTTVKVLFTKMAR
jgi:sugar transferase (PEP-CTERM system associated)